MGDDPGDPDAQFGYSTSLGHDGTRIAIGATQHGSGPGYASIYDYIPEYGWVRVGRMDGVINQGSFGCSVSLSSGSDGLNTGSVAVCDFAPTSGSGTRVFDIPGGPQGPSPQVGDTVVLRVDGELKAHMVSHATVAAAPASTITLQFSPRVTFQSTQVLGAAHRLHATAHTVPAHLNPFDVLEPGCTLAPHGGPLGARVVGGTYTGCAVVSGYRKVDAPAFEEGMYLHSGGCTLGTIMDVLRGGVGLQVSPQHERQHERVHISGTGYIIMGDHVDQTPCVALALGHHGGVFKLPLTMTWTHPTFRCPLSDGIYDAYSISSMITKSMRPGNCVAGQTEIVFVGSHLRNHTLHVLHGDYLDLDHLIQGIVYAMNRCDPDGTYVFVSDGESTRITSTYTMGFALHVPLALSWAFGGPAECSLSLYAQAGTLGLSNLRRLGARGRGTYCLEPSSPYQQHFQWQPRWDDAGPVSNTPDGDLVVQIHPSDPTTMYVQSRKVYMHTEENGSRVVSTCAPIALQQGDIVLVGCDGITGGSITGVVMGHLPPEAGVSVSHDAPDKMNLLRGMASTDGQGSIRGSGTSFLELQSLLLNHPQGTLEFYIDEVGVFQVVSIESNSEMTIGSSTDTRTGGGAISLVTRRGALPYTGTGADGSRVAIAVASTGPCAGLTVGNNAVHTLKHLLPPGPWRPILNQNLERRLGFPGLPSFTARHVSARSWSMSPVPYVLLCIELPDRDPHEYLLGLDEVNSTSSSGGYRVILGKFNFGHLGLEPHGNGAMVNVAHLRDLHISIRNPDMTLFHTGGIENACTLQFITTGALD